MMDRGSTVVEAPNMEYRGIYRRFVELVEGRESDVDLAPLGLVADAFLLGRRRLVAEFND
jgi:D-galactose 1-dehydrogenase